MHSEREGRKRVSLTRGVRAHMIVTSDFFSLSPADANDEIKTGSSC